MTRKHLVWLAVVAGAAAAALVALNLAVLPMDASWRTNRVLHYLWEVLAGLATVGGGVWTMWPRDTRSRKDVARQEAQRRVIGLVGIVMAAVLLVVFAEVRRELVSRRDLESTAEPALKTIAEALDRYEADHKGADPASLEALVPQYLKSEALLYPYRHGPVAAPAAEGSQAEPPSYALAHEVPGLPTSRPLEAQYRAYLRPGNAWAGLSAVIDKRGQFEIIADDMVSRYEWQFREKS